MLGVSSLRSLERLARIDLGAMWVTGGFAPDHANIGRLIAPLICAANGVTIERLVSGFCLKTLHQPHLDD